MSEKLLALLQVYQDDLAALAQQPDAASINICAALTSLARIYELLGDHAQAQHHFAQAATAGIAWLDDPRSERTVRRRPYAHSMHLLKCARLLWRADNPQAAEYFQHTIMVARTGVDTAGDVFYCWLNIMYSHLFLGEYPDAAEALERARTILHQSKRVFDPPEFFDTMEAVVLACQAATAMAYRAALTRLDSLFTAAQASFTSAEAPPSVDIHELLKRKLAACTDTTA